jgi:hypothetical protein
LSLAVASRHNEQEICHGAAGTVPACFWEKHGLDVEIARGSGSVAAAQAIGEARFDFGMASPSASILQAIRGCRPSRSLLAHMTRRWASEC